MPTYVSKNGVFHPAKEHAVLPHLSGTPNEVYDGPDRAAMHELALAHGVDTNGKPKELTFGIDFRNDPDMINRARSLGFKNVDEYARAMGYNKTKEEEAKINAEKDNIVNKYEPPKRSEEHKMLGGGTDTSGQGNDTYGGLGSDPHGLSK